MRRATPPVRQGPGLSEALAHDAPRRELPPATVEPRKVVIVPMATVTPDDPGLPSSVRTLAAAAEARGWRTWITYSRFIDPPKLYAKTAKNGKAGQVRRPAAVVACVVLRVATPYWRAWLAWLDGRTDGGQIAALRDDRYLFGVRPFSVTQLKTLIDAWKDES